MISSMIVGTGSYLPEMRVKNEAFSKAQFFQKDGTKMYKSNRTIIDKFQEITGIEERRYAKPEQNASELAFLAAADALETSLRTMPGRAAHARPRSLDWQAI